MEVTKVYTIGDVSFTLNDGDEKTILKVGRKVIDLYTSDVMDFCKAFLATDTPVVPAVVAALADVSRRRAALADFDNRTAVSSTPVRSITRDEMAKMERPLTPIPGVTFGAVMDMPRPSNVSFKLR